MARSPSSSAGKTRNSTRWQKAAMILEGLEDSRGQGGRGAGGQRSHLRAGVPPAPAKWRGQRGNYLLPLPFTAIPLYP